MILSHISEGVVGASSSFFVLHQHAFFQKIFDVVQCGVRRAFGDFGPFARREFAKETVELHIDELSLSFVHWLMGKMFPIAGFLEDVRQRFICAFQGFIETNFSANNQSILRKKSANSCFIRRFF